MSTETLISYRMFLKDGTEVGKALVPGFVPWGYRISFFVVNGKYVTVEPVKPGEEGEAEYTSLPFREAVASFTRGYLASHLCQFDGNITKTAESIGMERSLLYRKMRSLGLREKRAVE